IVAVDEERDIALIQIKAPEAKNLKPLTMAGNRPIERAEVVAAWGYPGGSLLGGGLKFTQGAISSIPERGTGQMLLLDVKINPGNSGGPLCDIHGNVIGMVTAKTGASRTFESYGMAIPAKDLEGFLTKHLKSYKSGVASRKPLKWDQVDRQVSPSVLMILNSGN
ncbi:MAG: trypsin-like peptidase domain-containing protein, partial [Planctomycetia bacterium]|nr:trypsin-like peptidase domain-containing protein [Planctomycetia bacterium]